MTSKNEPPTSNTKKLRQSPTQPVIDAANLAAIRQFRGLDQLTLARLAGINRSIISRLERDLQTDLMASVLAAIAQVLQVPTDLLLSPLVRPHLVPLTLANVESTVSNENATLQETVTSINAAANNVNTSLLALTPDLLLEIAELKKLTQAQQHQVAALLRAYISTSSS